MYNNKLVPVTIAPTISSNITHPTVIRPQYQQSLQQISNQPVMPAQISSCPPVCRAPLSLASITPLRLEACPPPTLQAIPHLLATITRIPPPPPFPRPVISSPWSHLSQHQSSGAFIPRPALTRPDLPLPLDLRCPRPHSITPPAMQPQALTINDPPAGLTQDISRWLQQQRLPVGQETVTSALQQLADMLTDMIAQELKADKVTTTCTAYESWMENTVNSMSVCMQKLQTFKLTRLRKLKQNVAKLQSELATSAAENSPLSASKQQQLNHAKRRYCNYLNGVFPLYTQVIQLAQGHSPTQLDNIIASCRSANAVSAADNDIAARPLPEDSPAPSPILCEGDSSSLELPSPPVLTTISPDREYGTPDFPLPPPELIPITPEPQAMQVGQVSSPIPELTARIIEIDLNDLHPSPRPLTPSPLSPSAIGNNPPSPIPSTLSTYTVRSLPSLTSTPSTTTLPSLPSSPSTYTLQSALSTASTYTLRSTPAPDEPHSYEPYLLLWREMVDEIKAWGFIPPEERLQSFASFNHLDPTRWASLARYDGLTEQGEEMLQHWQNKASDLSEEWKTETRHEFFRQLTKVKDKEAFTPERHSSASRESAPLAGSSAAVMPLPQNISLPNAPHLSWLANHINEDSSWADVRSEAVPPLIVRTPMFRQRRALLVITNENDTVRRIFDSTSSAELLAADLLANQRSLRLPLAVIQYVAGNHYNVRWAAGQNVRFRTQVVNGRNEVVIDASSPHRQRLAIAPSGHCLTEAAAVALLKAQNPDLSDERAIALAGAELRREICEVIVDLPASEPALLANLETHISIMLRHDSAELQRNRR